MRGLWVHGGVKRGLWVHGGVKRGLKVHSEVNKTSCFWGFKLTNEIGNAMKTAVPITFHIIHTITAPLTGIMT